MKTFKFNNSTIYILLIIILFSACKSSTVIQSIPSNAKLYINNQFVGHTPYTYSDKKIAGTRVNVRLEKDGFIPYRDSFFRNEKLEPKALYFGVFIAPLFWMKKYDDTRTFDIFKKGKRIEEPIDLKVRTADTGEPTKEQRLKELQFRYDNKFIDKKTYEREKKRILEEGMRP